MTAVVTRIYPTNLTYPYGEVEIYGSDLLTSDLSGDFTDTNNYTITTANGGFANAIAPDGSLEIGYDQTPNSSVEVILANSVGQAFDFTLGFNYGSTGVEQTNTATLLQIKFSQFEHDSDGNILTSLDPDNYFSFSIQYETGEFFAKMDSVFQGQEKIDRTRGVDPRGASALRFQRTEQGLLVLAFYIVPGTKEPTWISLLETSNFLLGNSNIPDPLDPDAPLIPIIVPSQVSFSVRNSNSSPNNNYSIHLLSRKYEYIVSIMSVLSKIKEYSSDYILAGANLYDTKGQKLIIGFPDSTDLTLPDNLGISERSIQALSEKQYDVLINIFNFYSRADDFNKGEGFRWGQDNFVPSWKKNNNLSFVSIWDPYPTKIKQVFWKSGNSDETSLSLVSIVPEVTGQNEVWKPKISRGMYYIGNSPYYYHSDDAVIKILDKEDYKVYSYTVPDLSDPILSKRGYFEFPILPKTGAHISVTRQTFNRDDDSITNDLIFDKVEKFTGLIAQGTEEDTDSDPRSIDTQTHEFKVTINRNYLIEDFLLPIKSYVYTPVKVVDDLPGSTLAQLGEVFTLSHSLVVFETIEVFYDDGTVFESDGTTTVSMILDPSMYSLAVGEKYFLPDQLQINAVPQDTFVPGGILKINYSYLLQAEDKSFQYGMGTAPRDEGGELILDQDDNIIPYIYSFPLDQVPVLNGYLDFTRDDIFLNQKSPGNYYGEKEYGTFYYGEQLEEVGDYGFNRADGVVQVLLDKNYYDLGRLSYSYANPFIIELNNDYITEIGTDISTEDIGPENLSSLDYIGDTNGSANQELNLSLFPISRRTLRLFLYDVVSNEIDSSWVSVPSLVNYDSNQKVFEENLGSGIIKFGDGVHGSIPPESQRIYASYVTGLRIEFEPESGGDYRAEHQIDLNKNKQAIPYGFFSISRKETVAAKVSLFANKALTTTDESLWLKATVRDKYDNLMQGAAVTFNSTDALGYFSNKVTLSDTKGEATSYFASSSSLEYIAIMSYFYEASDDPETPGVPISTNFGNYLGVPNSRLLLDQEINTLIDQPQDIFFFEIYQKELEDFRQFNYETRTGGLNIVSTYIDPDTNLVKLLNPVSISIAPDNKSYLNFAMSLPQPFNPDLPNYKEGLVGYAIIASKEVPFTATINSGDNVLESNTVIVHTNYSDQQKHVWTIKAAEGETMPAPVYSPYGTEIRRATYLNPY